MKDKAVIVTGAATGLGRAVALRLAKDEYTVAVTDIDGEGAQRVVDTITDAGGTAIARSMDVTDADAVETTVDELVESLGGLWGLVNNAGVGRATEFLKMTVQEWDWVQTVNARGVFLVSRYVAPHLVNAGGGSIVNMSSIAGRDGFPMWTHYAASKHAVIGLTRAMARELGPDQVRVNAVCPGAIKTDIWSAEAQATDNPDAVLADFVSRMPLRRAQTAEDVAAATAFLLSLESNSITGQSLGVDGGLLV
jgi:NAD(P)-dependent dehydrogenase (short-subunit alcohol dehydrogenase family)